MLFYVERDTFDRSTIIDEKAPHSQVLSSRTVLRQARLLLNTSLRFQSWLASARQFSAHSICTLEDSSAPMSARPRRNNKMLTHAYTRARACTGRIVAKMGAFLSSTLTPPNTRTLPLNTPILVPVNHLKQSTNAVVSHTRLLTRTYAIY